MTKGTTTRHSRPESLRREGPIRVLELRSVRGTGGGPEKTILLGAARSDPSRVQVTVCYIRDRRDPVFGIGQRAAALGVDYVEIVERHSFDLSVIPALRKVIQERHIDIVHAHDHKTDVLAFYLAWSCGITPLSTAHGWTGHSRRERLVYYPCDRRLLARFPRVIAVSGEIRAALIGAGAAPDRVVTVLNGIDPGQFRRRPGGRLESRRLLGIPDGAIVIGGVGRTEPQKRFDLLLDAFAALPGRTSRHLLVIAGDGSVRGALEQQAARLGIEAACVFLGHCDDMIALHHALDLLVQSSEYEGTPNVVLEAMAMQTPLVATDVGGTAELARPGEHALIVPPHDAGALSMAIAGAFADPAATHERVAAARRRVEHELSFRARTEAVERIYAALIAEQAGRRLVAA